MNLCCEKLIVKPSTEPLNDLRRKASNEWDRAVVVLIFLFVTFVIVRLFDSLENDFTVSNYDKWLLKVYAISA